MENTLTLFSIYINFRKTIFFDTQILLIDNMRHGTHLPSPGSYRSPMWHRRRRTFLGGRSGSLVVSASGDGPLKILKAAAASLLIIATVSCAVTLLMPWTPDDAMHHALETSGDPGDSFVWYSPVIGGASITLVMDVPEDAFRESMGRNLIRWGTALVPFPSNLVDPGDPYVERVADHILEEVGDRSDLDRAEAALNFVQTSIGYVSDERGYGCGEFWATPTETLYLHGGDCEDQAVLLCSILLAMGLECVLLDFPDHVAVGLLMGDEDGYLFCEATSSVPTDVGWTPSDLKGQTPELHVPGEYGVLPAVSKSFAWLRYLVEDATGI